jgi:hypothetical protein
MPFYLGCDGRLISSLAPDGGEIMRRVDASPHALLGLTRFPETGVGRSG